VNGPASTVVSGEVAALDELVGLGGRWVPVDYASHSAQVDAIRDQILEDLAGLVPGSGRVPFYSSVTGG
ncbi:acyltransferase domain-containing protein, partial [Streptomyces johnsoniae]